MNFKMKNIGKIRSAEVELDGITVIAGENDTGKSTVSKALFCAYNTLYNARKQIHDERIGGIRGYLSQIYRCIFTGIHMPFDPTGLAEEIYANAAVYQTQPDALKIRIMEVMDAIPEQRKSRIHDDDIDEIIRTICRAVGMDDRHILAEVAKSRFEEEFDSQILNLFDESFGSITLTSNSSPTVFEIDSGWGVTIENPAELQTRLLYLDDPFVLDNLDTVYVPPYSSINHRSDLQTLLKTGPREYSTIDRLIATENLTEIYRKLSSVCLGDVTVNKARSYGYRLPSSEKVLDFRNLSAGLKTFAILKTLLQNGSLESRGALILDEPEIHLHPSWQLVFAELIVLLRKEFKLRILLTTHSPYFLEAIEVYSRKHTVSESCRYYLARNVGSGSEIEEVTGRTELIYKQLAAPIQTLINVEDGDD